MDLTLAPRSLPRALPAQSIGKLNPEYREIVDETVELLHATKARLRTPQAEITAVSRKLWQDWRETWIEAAGCLPELLAATGQLQLAKAYTESRLTGELLEAPLWRQAYAKPLGYPGDYVVMEHIYEGAAAGDTPFGQAAHALGVHIGQFVVKRKDLVRQAIADAVARHAESGPCVIASLGCGPSREVVEFLAHDPLAARPARFFLVDQDGEALCHAGRKLAAAVCEGPSGGATRIEMRHVSVLRLLREIDPAELLPPSDLIYSAGLLDYFSDRTCRVLTRRLYGALRPGGQLLLGNMKAGTDMPWPLELIADWSLGYRSAESILAWTDGLAGAEIALRTEATGYDYLLSIRKS